MRNTTTTLLDPAALTETTTGDAVDLAAFHGLVDIILTSSETGASGQTAVVTIEHSDKSDTGFTSAGVTFATVDHTEASTQTAMVNIDQVKQYVRAKVTLAGTTPTVTCAVLVSGKRNYA